MDQDLERYLAEKGWKHRLVEGNRQILIEEECPFCGKRKHLMFNAVTTTWDCKRCGETGNLLTMRRRLGDLQVEVKSASDYIFYRGKPDAAPLPGERPPPGVDVTYHRRLMDGTVPEVLEYLMGARGFTRETLERFKIGVATRQGKIMISIPHYYRGELVCMKFRSVPPDKKVFIRWKDCPSVLFNGDSLIGLDKLPPRQRKVAVCEGEFDAMALVQYGYERVVSTTTGAGSSDWPEHWLEPLEHATSVYLGYDADQAGEDGANKAAATLGKYRCRRFVPPLNDWNACLSAGVDPETIKQTIQSSREYEGQIVKPTTAYFDDLRKALSNPEPKGRSTGWMILDTIIGGIRDGELTVVTGDTGCLVGETEVQINRARNGKRLPLSELVRRQNRGMASGKRWDRRIPTFIQSVVEPGYWGLAQVVRAVDAGVQETLRVQFSNGRELVGTEDHKVLTPDGQWMRLGELRDGDSVSCKDQGRSAVPQIKKQYRQVGGLRFHPRATHRDAQHTPCRVPYHRLVVEAELNKLPMCKFVDLLRNGGAQGGLNFLPRDVEVHHKDGDVMNNDLSNLEPMLRSDHKKLHAARDEAWKNFGLYSTGFSTVLGMRRSGKRPTYDLTVAGTHNYLANGIVTHNSGKSTWSTALCRNQILQGVPCMVAPFEQRPHDVIGKLVGMDSGQDIFEISTTDLEAHLSKVADYPLYFIDDSGSVPLGTLKDAVYLAAHRYGVRFVVLDHLHFFLNAPEDRERQAIDATMKALAQWVVDLQIHIALVVHPAKLGRTPRGDIRKPTLDDLKGSSEIKKLCWNGIRVWRNREEVMGSRADDVEIAVLKCRSSAGSEGSTVMSFDPQGEQYIEHAYTKSGGFVPYADDDNEDIYGGWDQPH